MYVHSSARLSAAGRALVTMRRWGDLLRRIHHEQRSYQTCLIAAVIIGAAVPGVPGLLSDGDAEKRAIARLAEAEAQTRRLSDIVAGIGLQQAIGATAATASRRIETDSSERYQRQTSFICGRRG